MDGVYAAVGVVEGLDQLSVVFGQGTTAAHAVHMRLGLASDGTIGDFFGTRDKLIPLCLYLFFS